MVIRLEKAGKKIRNNIILDNINMELRNGRIYGFQGINGCGKTMLMRLISGLMKPTSGSVIVDEKILGKDIDFPEKMGLLLENPAFLEHYTGVQNLKLLAGLKEYIDEEQIYRTLRRVGLNPNDKRKYKKYSLGMKQKLGIAAAIMEQPELLILDEPTNALDQRSIASILNIIMEEKKRGALIVLACHDGYILENLADEIFTLENGRIVNTLKR